MALPALIPMLIGALVSAVGTVVGRVLISLAIGYVTYQGIQTGLDFLKNQIASAANGLPSQALAVLGAMRVGEGLAIIFSAFAVRMLLEGLQPGGKITKMIIK